MRFFIVFVFTISFALKGYSQLSVQDSVIVDANVPTPEKAEAVRQEGHQLVKDNKYELAILRYQQALNLFQSLQDSVGMAKCYNNIGYTQTQLGNGQETIKALYQAIQINKSIKQSVALSGNYINLGTHYWNQDEYTLSAKYFEDARIILEGNNNPIWLANAYIGIGNILGNENYARTSYDSAYLFYSKAADIFREQNSQAQLANVYNNIGVLFENNNQPDSALANYEKSISIRKSLGDRRGQIYPLLNIGNIYKHQGNYGIALDYFIKGTELALEFGDNRNYIHLLSNTIKCRIRLGQLEEADKLFLVYMNLKDSINNEEKIKQLKELEAIYETEKTGKELEEQIRQTQAQTKLSKWFLAIAIGIGLLLAITVMFFIQRQRFNQRLKKQEFDRLKKEQEIIELNAMMQGQEEERNRIAEDLHDRLGARLSAIKLLSEERESNNGGQLTQMLEASIKETREISHNLSTDMLTRFGLENAITDLVNTVNASNKIEGDFTTTNMDQRLSVEIERPFYHMISELVNNTIKHAQASSFFIQLTRDGNSLHLLYEDDGKGFDLNSSASSGMGMQNLRARAEGMGGELTIDTAPGNGMHVMIHVSIP